MRGDVKLNHIYNENCVDTMDRMPDNLVDLVVTSPPYDNLRTYNGYTFDFESISTGLYQVIKPGGVLVWIVGDATIQGSETGTSFWQALYLKELGFNLHDTMIWNKGGFSNPGSLNTRYAQVFEYMFVFSKGPIKTFNPLRDRKTKHAGRQSRGTTRHADGSLKPMSKRITIHTYSQRYNIWEQAPYARGRYDGNIHPAVFPEQLVRDHIVSWSNPHDLVYDPFMGSGTTAKVAIMTNRDYIGSEISAEYCAIAEKRIMVSALDI